MTSLRTFFGRLVATDGAKGPTGEVAAWLASGEFEPSGFETIVVRHGVRREVWFRKQMLDLVLAFLQDASGAGRFSPDVVGAAHVLKHALHVEEGEFVAWRPAEVAALLNAQLEPLLTDGVLDDDEDLYCVELQALFDLSVDQYLLFTRSSFERAWSMLAEEMASASAAAVRASVQRKAQALEPLYRLARRQQRTLGALF